MKKGIVPILFTSVMLLAGCGNAPAAPAVPTVNSLSITNKEDLKAAWYVGDDDRAFTVESNPALDYTNEWKPSGHLRLSVLDKTVIEYAGVGNMIKALKPGTTTVSVLYYGVAYDSVEITIGTNRPEPNVKNNYDLLTMFTEISNADDPSNPHQKYHGTYEIETIKREASGYMTIKDDTKSGLVVYGSSKNYTFNWVTPGKYEYKPDPNDFDKDADLMNLEPGDTVTGDFIGFLYNGQTFELFCKIESVAKKSRPAPTGIEITKEGVEAEVGLPVQLEATVSPAEASQIVDWSVVNGTGKAKISAKGKLSATQAGTVTVTAKAHANTEISTSWEITVAPSSDNGLVVEPAAGSNYVMSFWKNEAHYYYTGAVQSSWYGKSSNKWADATKITMEQNGDGKWAISHILDGSKKYIGMHEGGGHINFKWDLATPVYGTWDEDFMTFVFSDVPDGETEAKEYILCTDLTNSSNSFRAIEATNLGSDRYAAVHFHTEEPVQPTKDPINATVTEALAVIAALADNASTDPQEYIVTGYVVYKGDTWTEESKYKNANFAIADSATETDREKELTVFRYADKTIFDSLEVGVTKVTVRCTLTKYVKSGNVTPETNENPTVTVIPAK